MSKSNSFQLDGKEILFQDGQTVMDAALEAGEYIPHLCHNPEFPPHGSCRVCIVKKISNGQERYVSACTQPVNKGMQIESNSEAVNNHRRSLVQMLFVEGNHVCPGCEKSGACQLQAIAYYVGMLSPHFTHFFPRREMDASHHDVVIDYDRCILCELCIRASHDIDDKNVFALSGRGIKTHLVVNSPDGKLASSTFQASDKAAHVCPVGAILPKGRAYEVPIGKRFYDQQPINIMGDAVHADNNVVKNAAKNVSKKQ